MEHLTKQQITLLCVLIALITSVATAISVVSLTDESGLPTQTIYKVIERSIDKVADLPTKDSTPAPIKETKPVSTVFPSDIAQLGVKSLVRIYETSSGTKQFVALGVAVGSKSGVLTSSLLVPNYAGSTYIAIAPDGTEVPATFSKDDISGSFAFFVMNYPAGSKSKVPSIELKSISNLKLGANVVAVGGKESGDVVSTGIVAELRPLTEGATTGKTSAIVITDMTLTSTFSGFLLFDTSGVLVAFEQGIDTTEKTPIFLDAGVVKAALAGLL